MISLNATIFVQVTLFLILLFILNKKLIQPLHQVILERQDYIKNKTKELEELENKLKELEQQYEERLQLAAREAIAIKEKYRREGAEIARDTMIDVQETVSKLRLKVKAEVEEELGRAREKLHELAEALSYDFTEKVLGRRI